MVNGRSANWRMKESTENNTLEENLQLRHSYYFRTRHGIDSRPWLKILSNADCFVSRWGQRSTTPQAYFHIQRRNPAHQGQSIQNHARHPRRSSRIEAVKGPADPTVYHEFAYVLRVEGGSGTSGSRAWCSFCGRGQLKSGPRAIDGRLQINFVMGLRPTAGQALVPSLPTNRVFSSG